MSNPYPSFIVSLLVLALLVVAMLRMPRRLPRESVAVPIAQLEAAHGVARSIRIRILLSFGAGLVVFLFLLFFRLPGLVWDFAPTPWYGVAQGLGPVISGAVALVVLAVISIPSWPSPDGIRTADLASRSWQWSLWWRRLVPVVIACAALALLAVSIGVSAATYIDGGAPTFVVVSGTYEVEGAPYPGWAYGLPMLVGMIVVAVLVVVVFRRVENSPSAPPVFVGLDAVMRQTVIRSATTIGLVSAILSIGEFLWVAGAAVSSAATVHPMGDNEVYVYRDEAPHLLGTIVCRIDCSHTVLVQPTFAFGIVEIAVGVLCIVFAVLLLVRSIVSSEPELTT